MAIQQNAVRHTGTGSAIGNGNTCSTPDNIANAHNRNGISRIDM